MSTYKIKFNFLPSTIQPNKKNTWNDKTAKPTDRNNWTWKQLSWVVSVCIFNMLTVITGFAWVVHTYMPGTYKFDGQVLRLVRLLRFSNSAKRMLALVTHVIPNAMRLLAIIASALYFYSVVGMESFAGCLSNRTLVKGSSYDVQNILFSQFFLLL